MQINSTYVFIDNKKALELAMVAISSAKFASVDTESSGYYTYYPKVCLIQITADSRNYIIDPFAKIDISILGGVFKNPGILKIFHSAQDDIKALKRDFNFEFINIADTMYSSKLLGLEHNSLEFLVEKYQKVKLKKTEQKSNWEKRPLDREQLKYAAFDTAFLESIWEKMRSELKEKGLLEEADSEFKRFADEPYVAREATGDIAWHKFPEILKFSPEERRNIYDILKFREEKAKRTNRAPFRILNNDIITKIVKDKYTEEKLSEILGKKDGKDLTLIIQSPSGPPLQKEDIPKPDYDVESEEEPRFRRLRKWRDKVMKKRNVDHNMMPSNRQLAYIIKMKPDNIESLRSLSIMSDWKVANYGPSLICALKGDSYDDLISNLKQIPATPKPKKDSNENQKAEKVSPKEETKSNIASVITEELNSESGKNSEENPGQDEEEKVEA